MLRGIALAVLGALLFGAVTMSAKSLLENGGPATIGMLTYLGAGFVGACAAALSHAPYRASARTRADHACFSAALVLGAMIAPLLLMTGLQSTSASFGSVLANIEGIATAIAAWCLFREKTSMPAVVSVITVLAGVVFFTAATDLEASGGLGPLLVGWAYLCWALDLNLMRRARNFDPAAATAIRGIIGALVMGGVAALKGEAFPDTATIAGGLLTGAIGFGISFILVLKALPLIGSAKAGAMFASAPVFGYVYSLAIEGGALDMHRLTAMVIISLGILIAAADAFAKDRTANRNLRRSTVSWDAIPAIPNHPRDA